MARNGMAHVLVTNDSYRPSLGVVRSLGRKGIRVSVLADSPDALASWSRYCHRRYVVGSPLKPSTFCAIDGIVRKEHFDLIIPVGYNFSLLFAQHKSELPGRTTVELTSYENIRAAADKWCMYHLARECGVPVPTAVCAADEDAAVHLSTDLRFPVVIKPSCESPNCGASYAMTPADVRGVYRSVFKQMKSEGPVLIQEVIPGHGCGFFALYQQGVCKRVFMHRRVRESPPNGGFSTCAESFFDPKLKAYGTRLLDRLRWHGVAMVEFRYDERDADYKLLEVNPKFWGSLDLALAAGVDFPYYLLQMSQGYQLEYSDHFDKGLRYQWLSGDVRHAWQRPSALGDIIRDSVNPHVRSNFWLRDPAPNLYELFLMRSLVRWFATACSSAG